ncbi:MAG: hypothetical protein H7231_05635 [Rhodoferax sp.]|nr:hypothetical protein [Actinomycetota bacterium]
MSPLPDRDRPDEDVDAEFLRIIAGWDDTPTLVAGPAPTDVAPPAPAPTTPTMPTPPVFAPPPDFAPTPGPRDHTPPEEPDEGYVPPDPPPLPRGDVVGVLAWAAVLLGPLFLLMAGLFWREASPLWLGLAVVAFVGGFVALVMRLPSHRDVDDDDDGARL